MGINVLVWNSLALIVNDGKTNSLASTVTVTATVSFHLYGGNNYSTYLGCLNCNQYSSESVCNAYGDHGSSYAVNSIWNEYGTYGSQYNLYSPWNPYSISGPKIIGSDSMFWCNPAFTII